MRVHKKIHSLIGLGIVIPILLLAMAGMTSAANSQPDDPRSSMGKNQWDLVFNGDFNSHSMDPSIWRTCYWWSSSGCTNKDNHELEWYTPGNVLMKDGKLQLVARKEPAKALDGKTYAYTSGMVTTGRSTENIQDPPGFAFTYGLIEVRAWVPKGKGLWPAIWMLPADQKDLPEIDVMEILGDDPKTVHMSFHYPNIDGTTSLSEGQWTAPMDLSAGWHTYAVDWEPDRIVWYVDGVQRREFTQRDVIPHQPMYVIINLAVGGDWPGNPNAHTVFPSVFRVDSVRVWQHSTLISRVKTEIARILSNGKHLFDFFINIPKRLIILIKGFIDGIHW